MDAHGAALGATHAVGGRLASGFWAACRIGVADSVLGNSSWPQGSFACYLPDVPFARHSLFVDKDSCAGLL